MYFWGVFIEFQNIVKPPSPPYSVGPITLSVVLTLIHEPVQTPGLQSLPCPKTHQPRSVFFSPKVCCKIYSLGWRCVLEKTWSGRLLETVYYSTANTERGLLCVACAASVLLGNFTFLKAHDGRPTWKFTNLYVKFYPRQTHTRVAQSRIITSTSPFADVMGPVHARSFPYDSCPTQTWVFSCTCISHHCDHQHIGCVVSRRWNSVSVTSHLVSQKDVSVLHFSTSEGL